MFSIDRVVINRWVVCISIDGITVSLKGWKLWPVWVIASLNLV